MSILLAEDVLVNQELAATLLRKWGCRVDVADDGVAAVDAIQTGNYDLVLMDIHMPTMDGVAATRRIRALEGPAARVPIIAMTANVLRDDIDRVKAAGMNDHIGKPFVARDLKRKIAQWRSARGQTPIESDTLISHNAQSVSVVLDLDVFEDFTALLGEERTHELIQRFGDDLSASFADTGEQDANFRDAHAIASSAGSIGFLRLSRAAKALENAINEGLSPFELVNAVVSERDAARSTIDRLSTRYAKATAADRWLF